MTSPDQSAPKAPVYLDAATPAASPDAAPAPSPAPSKPLMAALESIGVGKPLEDANINIYGFVEGSYNYNLTSPKVNPNEGRSFDQYKNQGVLNQADLTIERTVDPSKKQFDIGFRIEGLWGSDASLVHSNGVADWYDGPTDPQNQFDLNKPFPGSAIGSGWLIRPEIRWDHSDNAFFGQGNDQATLAIDVIYNF